LTAHARDELGISEITAARPIQAALTSAATFSIGAAMPLLMVVVSPPGLLVPFVSAASLVFLALLGGIGAKAGGANIMRATTRVTFWGALAMAITAGASASYSARSFEGDILTAASKPAVIYSAPLYGRIEKRWEYALQRVEAGHWKWRSLLEMPR
jgi:hypothetical protein